MPLIDPAYAYNALGETLTQRLYTDAGVFNESALLQDISAASDIIVRAAENVGHHVNHEAPLPILREAVLGIFTEAAYGRKGASVPTSYAHRIDLASAILEGTYPLPTDEPANAIGGVLFSSSTDSPRNPLRRRVTMGKLRFW